MARLTAEYYTDPLCSWSWANEPHYRKLRADFGDRIAWRHRMGGLMEHWGEGFQDPTYDLQGGDAEAVAAHQAEVARERRVPLDPQFWFDHPYRSTFPLCVAVKAAGMQGFEPEDRYLRRVREGALVENRNLRTTEALVDLASEVPSLDVGRFGADVASDAAERAFEDDWRSARDPLPDARDTKETEGHVRYSFPALVLRNDDGDHCVLDGDHQYVEYLAEIERLAPELAPADPPDIEAFVRKYVRVTTHEVSLVCHVSWPGAEEALGHLVDGGLLRELSAGDCQLWELVDSDAPMS